MDKKRIPIVFFTAAVARRELLAHGGRIGGLPFLAKPADLGSTSNPASVPATLPVRFHRLFKP